MRPGSIMRKLVIAPVLARSTLADAKVLDLGGYDGSMTEELSARGAHVTVVDLDPRGIEIARGKGLGGVCASADAVPFPDAHFDLVICCDLLQSVPHEAEAPIFKEIGRVLKPSGLLVFTVPDSALKLPFVDMAAAYENWVSHPGITSERVRELAAIGKLEILESRDYFGLMSRLYYAVAFYKNLPRRGTRLKRAVFKRLIDAESLWCVAPQAHMIVARPKA